MWLNGQTDYIAFLDARASGKIDYAANHSTYCMAERDYEAKDWTKEEIDELLTEYVPVTIPVSIKVEGKHKVLGFDELERILRKAKLISIEPCWCRLRVKGCEGPVDVCVCVDQEAEDAIGKREGRKATFDEAMDALRRGHEAGLVHLAYETPGHEMRSICSCCSCCCHTMSGITRLKFYDPSIVGPADVIAVHLPETCTDCGVCVERCHFKAWSFTGDKVKHDSALCAGCGVCVSFCPSASIKLVKRKTKRTKKATSKKKPKR